MIDIHCHLLPAIDDGAKSWDVTLEMCRLAEEDGVTDIVATPHANYEYHYDRVLHLDLLEELRRDLPNVRNRHDPGAASLQQPMNPDHVLAALGAGVEPDQKPS